MCRDAESVPAGLTACWERLCGLPGVKEGTSRFRASEALFSSGREIAHLEPPSRIDLRLTRAYIRSERGALADWAERRASGSDWVTLPWRSSADDAAIVALVEKAVAANRRGGS